MTVFSLIGLMADSCAPGAEFMAGTRLWWVPAEGRYTRNPKGYLALQPTRPNKDAIDLSANENGPMKVGL